MFDLSRRTLLQTSCSLVLVLGMTASAKAELSISTKPTSNVNCSAGVCAATAKKAVLNVTDLGNMLAAGNVIVQSGSDAEDIAIDAPFSWTSSNALTLDSNRSITVRKPVSDSGPGALTLTTNDGGSGGEQSFVDKGKIAFLSTSNALIIDGQAYTLVDSIATLASAVTANPSGFYALANDYDAAVDGTYSSSPVASLLSGTLDGLGNVISHLKINDKQNHDNVGFIEELAPAGTVENFGLTSVNIRAARKSGIGSLVATNTGILSNDFVNGTITLSTSSVAGTVGGLVGINGSSIAHCHTNVSVQAGNHAAVGGLAGGNAGIISDSYSNSTVSVGKAAQAGGLIGINFVGLTGSVTDSYAIGTVTGGRDARVGGLVGQNGDNEGDGGFISASYSMSAVNSGDGSAVGGLVGVDNASSGSIAHTYWDLDTSGITDPKQGAGNIENDPGIKGLTDEELKSVLPKGFNKKTWAQSATINNGYPYLIDNPPAK